MSGPARTAQWGLRMCRPDLRCAVCLKFADEPEELRRLRDYYCEGVAEVLLVEMFEIPLRDLHRHCWQHGWVRRRQWNLPTLRRAFERLLLERMAKSWHLVSPTSADHALELLTKLVLAKRDR